ncbi:MAG: hypothetical protein EOO59_12215 [Hymenobacter sp.]|nr:MAG: hypothetical protein EOO59_12215 [Hymenobacter sp.]
MKKILLLLTSWLLLAAPRAEAQNQYVPANGTGDLVLPGTNGWLLHTPDDGRTTLYVVPWNGNDWNWASQAEFFSNGDMRLVGRLGLGVQPAAMNSLRLAVDGTIGAHAVKVTAVGVPWPDYVFSRGYRLRPLREVARHIALYHRLPEVPAAATVAREGLDLAATDALLLRKIEEVTLYLVALQQENEALQARVRQLEQAARRPGRR